MTEPYASRAGRMTVRGLIGGAAMLALAATSAAAADADFSQYTQIAKNAQATPSWTGPTEPAPAPKDKFLVEISCTHAVEGCKKNSDAIEDVAKRLGWRYKIIIVADATGFDAAVMTGINAGADGIILNGIDTKLIPGGIAAAKAKKIPLVSPQLLNEVGPDGVDADVSSDADAIGKILASKAIADHNGKMHVLMLNIAEWQLPARIMKSVKATLDSCSQCQVTYATPIDFTSSVIGTTLPQQVVAALRRDPKIDVIIEGIDPMANFIVPALDAAGMRDRVKMYTSLANPGPLQLMRDGNVLVTDIGVSLKWGVWGAIDQMIRIMNGQPTVKQVVPVQLLTMEAPERLPAVGVAYTGEASGFPERYLALWGVK
ncbi:MAG: sugar ABC transporter substrate-binding protein [Mesorhizobium sp.]|nr:MAG: sugar ABC transporter substrate-binding protein [Mesorhizobium sp.]